MNFHSFGFKEEPTETSPEILGGKGAGLVWMCEQGVRVPPGFVIPATVWANYDKKPKTILKEIAKTLPSYLAKLCDYFGYTPLLSVRSGARVSCPGMMDTILNVGLDPASSNTTAFWEEKLGAEGYRDSLHRLVTMYGSVVKGMDRKELEMLSPSEALHLYTTTTGQDFPDVQSQLITSIEAVFKSWDNERAKIYRKMNNIPREWGTAVTVQAMVFGNLGDTSGSGVLFTRNPDTGAKGVVGEFLVNAQGEDVVAGIRTPLPLTDMPAIWPAVYPELVVKAKILEELKHEAQDIEFTVQDGVLYFLQTRNAKRTATATIQIALDFMEEGLITPVEAVRRVSPEQLDIAQMNHLDPKFKGKADFKGLPACSGVVTGKPVFSSEGAINCKVPCILITTETTPDDVGGMARALGVITMTGGATSHAAVVARGMNKPCITGVSQPIEAFKEADIISMDGATGCIWFKAVPIVSGQHNGLIRRYSQLVCDVLGVVPIIRETPSAPLPEAMLYVGDRMLDTDKAVKFICEVAAKVDKLYLDLQATDIAEIDFFKLFQEHDLAQRLIVALETTVDASPELAGLRERLVVLGEVKTSFRMLGFGGSLRSMVLADKEVVIDILDNDPAMAKVVAWKKAEGVEFLSVGKKLEGVKSLMSVEQGLQALQEI